MRVGRNRVQRLMRILGIEGASRRKEWHTTKRSKDARPAPDLVERDFEITGPDQLWVADITYIPTWAGFPVPGRGRRCVQPPSGGLGDGEQPQDSARAGRLQHGALAAEAGLSHPSFGSGLSIHFDRVRASLQRGRRATLDGLCRRLLRQRDVRELLRHARMRTPRPQAVPDESRGEDRRVRLHRGVLQSQTETL